MSFRIAPITVQEEHSILTGLQIINTTRQQKLLKGNVSSHVCLLTGGSHVTITHDALDFTVKAGPLDMGFHLQGPLLVTSD